MEPLNYLREVKENVLKAKSKSMVSVMYRHSPLIKGVIDDAFKAPKFLIPNYGRILNNKLDSLPAELHLPFDSIVLEYSSKKGSIGIAERLLGKENTLPCPKRIVFATNVKSHNFIRVTAAFWNDDTNDWFFCPYYACISTLAETTADESGDKNFADIVKKIPGTDYGDAVNTKHQIAYEVIPGYEMLKSENWLDNAFADMNDEVYVVLELLQALSCDNVKPVKAVFKKPLSLKQKRSKLPLDTYHILTVDISSHKSESQSENEPSGEGTSPREHLRRGHIRTYKSGVKVWINACVVNPGTEGKVTKDYLVK